MARTARLLALLAAAAALACGGSTGSGSGATLGAPITGLATGTWSWVPFPDSACSDGSPTGIGVSPGTGPDLVFFLEGGGACASGLTCFTLRTATLGPFGAAEFAARSAQVTGTLLDRTLPGSPFADATLVYVPYCTGDVHGGSTVKTYTDGPGGTVHHVGHLNVLAYLKRVAATWPTPRRLVVTGSSAGGFGTLVNYPAFRTAFPSAQGFAVDDSGPPLPSDGGPLIQAGFAAWGIAPTLDALCGTAGACEADLSRGLSALLANHPSDRFALLSWSSDPTISLFYGIGQDRFGTLLGQLIDQVIAPAQNARAFVVAGASHTLLGEPTVAQGGVTLVEWLGEQVSGSAAWTTVRP